MLLKRNLPIVFVVLIIPCVIYVAHALYFGGWIVDDAGISFAYARSFAQGYGLVSQPGMLPVEGYSNFLWVLVLTPPLFLRLFDPAITPKLISISLTIGSFGIVYLMLKPVRGRAWITFSALTLTALNTSFVVWTISGLENALYVFLVVLMLLWSIQVACDEKIRLRNAVIIGLLVTLTGMTRPDGLAYGLAFPVIFIPVWKIGWQQKLKLLVVYGLTTGLAYGVFILFRLAYFGAPLPNTYYVKGGPKLSDVLNLLTLQPAITNRMQILLGSDLGGATNIILIGLVVGSLYLLAIRKWSGRAWALLIFMLCAFSIHLLLPPDWMGEYRFATAFFLLFYLYAAFIGVSVLNQLPEKVAIGAQVGLVTLAIVGTLNWFVPRSRVFNSNPTVPFEGIRQQYGDKYDWFKQTLKLPSASVMLPDIGGVLYYSNVNVYDLVGLTDRSVARYLGKDIDRPAFYNYTFDTIKPTFIDVHGFWTQHAQLDSDPRFTQLYVPICSYVDPWVATNYHVNRPSGSFILRSVADSHPDELHTIRQQLNSTCDLQRGSS